MTAQEAREKIKQRINSSISVVLDAIQSHCEASFDFEMWYYKPLSKEQKELLTELGYTLSDESNHRNEYLIKISW